MVSQRTDSTARNPTSGSRGRSTVVNLSAYESFVPEKRPFFVEGASIFNIG